MWWRNFNQNHVKCIRWEGWSFDHDLNLDFISLFLTKIIKLIWPFRVRLSEYPICNKRLKTISYKNWSTCVKIYILWANKTYLTHQNQANWHWQMRLIGLKWATPNRSQWYRPKGHVLCASKKDYWHFEDNVRPSRKETGWKQDGNFAGNSRQVADDGRCIHHLESHHVNMFLDFRWHGTKEGF